MRTDFEPVTALGRPARGLHGGRATACPGGAR